MFDPIPLARSSDPDTSHQAAARVHEFGDKHHGIIAVCLRQHGSLTADQIAALTRLDKYQVCRRLPEMERAGMVEPTGETRTTTSGRQARCWRLCDG